MFPLIPVLILLLLQGPSNIERLAQDGRLPQALVAAQPRIEAPASEVSQAEAMLASLLQAGADPDLSHALAWLLSAQDDAPKAVVLDLSEADELGMPSNGTPPDLSDGFLVCRRTRDGPFSA